MTVHYWKSVLVWTVSWKPWHWRRNVTVREKGRKSIIFRPGNFPKALISQRFIYKTLSLLVGLYMHLWMWHLRRRMSREDACLTISLERNDNLFQHIKEAKADQCHLLLMYKKCNLSSPTKHPSLNRRLLRDGSVVSLFQQRSPRREL